MTQIHRVKRIRLVGTMVLFAVLTGCASVNFDRSIIQANENIPSFTQGKLELALSQEQRISRKKSSQELLQRELGQGDAVQLALLNSPAMQTLLADNWSFAAKAAQSGRISNPVFMFERMNYPNELELVRMISFGLLDVLTLPQRYGIAEKQLEQAQTKLVADVVDEITRVRQSWVRAVAAQQTLIYARQVNEVAKVSAELARRMQSVGNFTKIQRARQQAFYADSATQLAIAEHAVTAAKEALIRTLGLTFDQAQNLRLPERLPNLPKMPLSPEEVSKSVNSNRIDIKLAQSALEVAMKKQ